MPINLLVDNVVEWASGGQLEEITIEKRIIGWTGSPSDYAFAVWINSIWNSNDKRANLICQTINAIMQKGIPEYNALYQYSVDSVITHAGKVYRAKQVSAGSPPPSGMTSNIEWELITGQEWVQSQLDLKADLESPELTGTPTTTTPTYANGSKQITNVEYVESQMLKRIRGGSQIDLTMLEASKAYPVLFAKDNLPTDTTISRDVGLGSSTLGNMRCVIRGIGAGLSKRNNQYLEVINMNDTSEASIGQFVKKIQIREDNCVIAVWLKGGAKYNIVQRNAETLWELVTANVTLENNWILSVEEWAVNQFLGDGTWSVKNQTDLTLDYTSTSDTGSVETCGVIIYSATKVPPLGALIANGAEVSRNTYSKLFDKIGVWFGVGDGSNTFNLPDLRGVVPRGLDMGKGLDSNQLITQAYGGSVDRTTFDGLGSYQSDAIRNITGQVKVAGASGAMDGGSGAFSTPAGGRTNPSAFVAGNSNYAIFNASNVVPTASENQVKNIALLPCIYYL